MRALAVALLGSVLAYQVVVALRGSYEADFDLPLHLTDAATLVAALASVSSSWVLGGDVRPTRLVLGPAVG